MTVETKIRARPAAVILTPAAEQRIADLMATAPEGTIGVKLSTPRRGCSGLAYSVDYVTEEAKFDEKIETPGGIFYIVEAHPLLQIFDDRVAEPALRLLYPYFHGREPIREEHPGCYSTPDAPITSVEHIWLHTVSDLINALARAGLRIETFDEYPFLGWRFFPWMERDADGWWRLPERPERVPLMYSIRALKA